MIKKSINILSIHDIFKMFSKLEGISELSFVEKKVQFKEKGSFLFSCLRKNISTKKKTQNTKHKKQHQKRIVFSQETPLEKLKYQKSKLIKTFSTRQRK